MTAVTSRSPLQPPRISNDDQRRFAQLPAVLGAVDAIMTARHELQPRKKPAPIKHLPPPSADDRPDVRYMTPRQMQEYSQDLYAAGILTFDDYEAMAFQPELHPNFNHTIGALIGRKAEPDRPRDFITYWRDRLDFGCRHYSQNSNPVRQARRIIEAISSFPRRSDIFA